MTMDGKQASEILRKHNRWRREGGAMNPNPRAIGEAIDVARQVIATVPCLIEALQEFAVQHKCGCGHPACNDCWRDRLAASALAKALPVPPNAGNNRHEP